jgi:hypothetical protein
LIFFAYTLSGYFVHQICLSCGSKEWNTAKTDEISSRVLHFDFCTCRYSLVAGPESYFIGDGKYNLFIPEDYNCNKLMFKIMFYIFEMSVALFGMQ